MAEGRLERVTRLLARLHRRRRLPTAQRLARETGVNVRTVYRDLDGLRLILLGARGEKLIHRPREWDYVVRRRRRRAETAR